jgi:hypothetical protein
LKRLSFKTLFVSNFQIFFVASAMEPLSKQAEFLRQEWQRLQERIEANSNRLDQQNFSESLPDSKTIKLNIQALSDEKAAVQADLAEVICSIQSLALDRSLRATDGMWYDAVFMTLLSCCLHALLNVLEHTAAWHPCE